ncbi:MAG: hypothetical protein FWF50_01415 [Defluviitaleaceae bacterium]|nr:hypothetical protein [Defluviitaleaceae bacterium]
MLTLIIFGVAVFSIIQINRNWIESPPERFEVVNHRYNGPVLNINRLASVSSYIVRAEIIYKKEMVAEGWDSFRTDNYYTLYKINILNVYQGYIEVGDTLEVVQFTKWRNYDPKNWRGVQYSIIHTPLEVGSDLILFLRPSELRFRNHIFWIRPEITMQSAFYYTPIKYRYGYEDWIFESVDERNTLVLTEEILYSIR